jgi:hypothetical protein
MSSITISNLQPAGLNLFSDSEGYLHDLDESEQTIQGGIWNMVSTPGYAAGFGLGLSLMAVGAGIGYVTAQAYHDYTHISI